MGTENLLQTMPEQRAVHPVDGSKGVSGTVCLQQLLHAESEG